MQPLFELLSIETNNETARNFRESLVNQFIDEILKERVDTKWEVRDEDLKEFKKGIALKINTNPWLKESWQLESFLKTCREGGSFGRMFFGLLKTKKYGKNTR